jgi:replicative DNA helicase
LHQAAVEQDADAKPPGQVLIFSPEMTVEGLMARHASQVSRVPSLSIKRGTATDDERDRWLAAAAEFVYLEPFFTLYAGKPVSINEVLDVVEQANQDGPPVTLVVIDYLQYLELGKFTNNYFEALGQAVKSLRVTANRLNIPFLVAAQLNRSVEKDRQGGDERPPELSDFEGSGKIEQTANVAMLLWRPPDPQRVEGDIRAQEATIFIRKNTDGPTGMVKLHYFPDIAMFADPDKSRVISDGGVAA